MDKGQVMTQENEFPQKLIADAISAIMAADAKGTKLFPDNIVRIVFKSLKDNGIKFPND